MRTSKRTPSIRLTVNVVTSMGVASNTVYALDKNDVMKTATEVANAMIANITQNCPLVDAPTIESVQIVLPLDQFNHINK